MRWLSIPLVAAGTAALVLALGFWWHQPWATPLWPWPAGRLSYAFMAAILTGSAVPLLWIGLSGEWAALAGYALGFGCMYGLMASYAFLLSAQQHRPALLGYGWVTLALSVLCLLLLGVASRVPLDDTRLVPRAARRAFGVEVGVLGLVGALLVAQIPILPWPLTPEASVMYGFVFLGMAFYFGYALFKPQWHHARGQLLGFLAYDLVLIGPLLSLFAPPGPTSWLGLIAATVIVLSSGLLAVYYLFLQSTTRSWLVVRPPETESTQGSHR